MLNFSHASGLAIGARFIPPHDVSRRVIEAIDAGLQKARADEPGRAYIGASAIGDPCARRLFYRATQAAATPTDPRMLRIWARGHAAEDRIIKWLRQAGFDVIDRDGDDLQIRFSQADGRFSGGVDGILTAGPVALPYPVLIEIKCLKSSSWNNLAKVGLSNYSQTYNFQAHLYMAYLNLKHCLYIAENADTMELWINLIPLDMATAQAASDRAAQLIRMVEAGDVPPRCAAARDHWLCRNCEFSDVCWTEHTHG